MRYFNVLRMLLVVVPLLSISTQASAQNSQIAVAGETRIGMIDGVAYAVTNPSGGGPCTYLNLGAGGLTGDAVIVGVDQGYNVVSFMGSAYYWCSHLMQPLITNGHDVSVYGGNFTDIMWGHHTGLGLGHLTGSGGDDILLTGSHGGTQTLFGSNGNDWLFATKPFTELHGNSGNDHLCNITGSMIYEMDGGSETDSHCGTAVNFSLIEQPGCNACEDMLAWLFGA